MKRFLTIFLAIVYVSAAHSEPLPYYVIDGQHENNSVTKLWYTALGLTDLYDKGEIAGFEIDFGNEGRHYNPEKGNNWWEYYFATTRLGSPEGAAKKRLPRHKRSTIRFETICTMTPERASFLLSVYLHFKSELLESLNDLKKNDWPRRIPVIGVYYQKPIMAHVQNDWSPELLVKRVKTEMEKHPQCSIILITDLSGYAAEFDKEFGSRCTHMSLLTEQKKKSGALHGEAELLTILMLSQCDVVIAPGSYQGIGAKMLAPIIELIELDTIPYALR